MATNAFYAIALTGIEVTGVTKYEEGFELVSFDNIPEDPVKDVLLGKEDRLCPFRLPISTAALIYKYEIPADYIPFESPKPDWLTKCIRSMHEASDVFTLIGLTDPSVIAFWNTADKSPGVAASWHRPEHEISWSEKVKKLSGEEAKTLFNIFKKLPVSEKDALRLAIQRLNLSLRRSDATDKAIELGISLESVLTHDRDKDAPVSYLVRLRGSLIAGGNIKKKRTNLKLLRAVYDLRSSAVHLGKLPTKVKEQTPDEILWEGSKLCAEIIRKIIRRGGRPKS